MMRRAASRPGRLLLVLPGLLALTRGTAAGRECAWWSGNGPSIYGLQNGLTASYAAHVDEAGLGGLRLAFRIDGQTAWTPELYARYDEYLATARGHGLAILGIVLYESTPLDQTAWNDDADGDGWNDYVTTFVGTAKALMERYGDDVKVWEIWNEPSCWSSPDYRTDPQHAGCYYILPRVYARLLAEVYVQGKATIDAKGLHLVSGGLFAHDIGGGFQPGVDYMTEVYDQGPWDWMQGAYGRRYPWDAFGYHVYVDQGGPTTAAHLAQYLDAIAALKSARGDASPVWMTEFGWSTHNVSEAQQAQNLDVALSLFEVRPEIERAFVFKVDDYDGWGLFRGDWTAKPAVAVMQAHAAGCTPPAAPPDAGPADASAPAADAAAGTADAAAAGDAPAVLVDAAPAAGGDGLGGGCGCASAAGAGPTGAAPGLLLALTLALALARGRRPRCTGPPGLTGPGRPG